MGKWVLNNMNQPQGTGIMSRFPVLVMLNDRSNLFGD